MLLIGANFMTAFWHDKPTYSIQVDRQTISLSTVATIPPMAGQVAMQIYPVALGSFNSRIGGTSLADSTNSVSVLTMTIGSTNDYFGWFDNFAGGFNALSIGATNALDILRFFGD